LRYATTWPVRPAGAPRIFEISRQDAWITLVQRHPIDVSDAHAPDWQHLTGRRGSWLIPNWRSVAEEFDAVHLTVSAYLTSAGQAIAVGPDAASVIAGWDPDATYWLTDSLQIVGPATNWVDEARHGDSWRITAERN
jgi:hypothetical protein